MSNQQVNKSIGKKSLTKEKIEDHVVVVKSFTKRGKTPQIIFK